jgi:site-specific recombinase XerD
MPLELKRRHLKTCPHRSKGVNYLNCSCPLHAFGYIGGGRVREALHTTDLARGLARMAELESSGTQAGPARISLGDAVTSYLGDCERCKLQPTTIRSYRGVLSAMRDHFGADRDISTVQTQALSEWCAGRQRQPRRNGEAFRPITSKTARKELEYVRAFFHFAVRQEWLVDNPASRVKMPAEDIDPAEPFTPEEVDAILDTCSRVGPDSDKRSAEWRQRARALVLVMLYSGMRVSDIAMLRRRGLSPSGHLTVRAAKNQAPVKVLLPKLVADALRDLPVTFGQEFFFRRHGLVGTVCNMIRVTLNRIGKKAGFRVHPHRFRDTFAAALLESGADLRSVQILLGHRSVKTTEKHYTQFQSSQQHILDSATANLAFTKPGAGPAVPLLKNRLGNP